MAWVGIDGQPFVDLSAFVRWDAVVALHTEIVTALARLPTRYTGGSHRSLGITPPFSSNTRPDYGEVIAALTADEFRQFASLADPLGPLPVRGKQFGEEGEIPLSMEQMRWLELAHGVYFPWKVYLELTESTGRWEDKAQATSFTREAQLHLPQTVRFAQSLPFETLGSVKILGLMPGDDGTVHRDGDPARQSAPDEFITIVPGPEKRLFVTDGEHTAFAKTHAYWFNDHDWHGVAADPWFRYSVRIDGRFTDDFRRSL